jgi:TonB-linked SusC/RagA family outer membrane protein
MKFYNLIGCGLFDRIPIQFLRVMKLTIFIFTITLLQVSASTRAQISLDIKNTPLKTVLKSISTQSGYDFLYNDLSLKQAKTVSLKVSNASLEEVLKQCFANQPLTYAIEDKTVVIKEKVPSFLERVVATLTAIDAAGRVVDAEGKPLPGASVKVKSSGKSVSTNAKGEFVLRNVEEGTVLVVSFIGYVSKEVDAAKEMGNVVLEISDSKLDEVQVIAYGTTTRRLSTGNIGTVTAKEIERQPVSNPLLALQGRVPGLVVTQNNGIPGGAVTVRIQGQNSIGKGNDPFYVVDGVPYISQMLATTNGGILGRDAGISSDSGTGNPFSYINPSDIESIDVLKDADATAIYGSRAANGAILITTKRGKSGPTKINFDLQDGWGQLTNNLELMNTSQYLQMRHEALRNDGIASLSGSDYDINGVWDENRFTDWQKELIGGTAKYTNINGSISGGTATNQYFVGGTYHRETTVFPGNFNDIKGSMHFNINNTSVNQKFKMTLSGNYLLDNNQLPSADLSNLATTLAPNSPRLFNSDGTLNWEPNVDETSTWDNPLFYTLQNYYNKTNNLLGNALLSYEVLPNLLIRSTFGYNRLQTDEFQAKPMLSYPPEYYTLSPRFANYSNSTIDSWIIEPQLSFKKNIGNATLDVLIGSTFQEKNNHGTNIAASGFTSDELLADIKSAATVTVNSTIASTYKYNALYSRINYNLLSKYILNLTARRDGSSRFGSENKLHNFGAIGAAWIFTEESFVKKNIPFLSFGKVKGSYGTTGNDQIQDYQFLNLYSSLSGLKKPYQGSNGLDVKGLPNPYLQWEETKKLNIGVDFGLLNDRILLTGNFAFNKSSNQLLGYALPFVTGFAGITDNFPATVQNSTWEFTLNTENIKNHELTWSSNLNFTIPKNKLISFPGIESSSYSSDLVVGQPIGIKKVLSFLGVDPAFGTYLFLNKEGLPIASPDYSSDNKIFINLFPKFYGGFENSFNYKGLQLNILLQFTKKIAPSLLLGNNSMPGIRGKNQLVKVLNRWQKEGDITYTQMYSSNNLIGSYYNALSSDALYEDASYVRLKNVALSYQLPQKFSQGLYLNNAKIFAQGQNLFTITKFSGLDPEYGGSLLKVLTIGVQIGL